MGSNREHSKPKEKPPSLMCSFLFVCTANLTARYAFSFAAKRRAATSLRETRKRTFRDSEPALRRAGVRMRGFSGAQSQSKAEGFGGVRIGNDSKCTKEKGRLLPSFFFGAPSGIRTRDPLIKSQLLYQLS